MNTPPPWLQAPAYWLIDGYNVLFQVTAWRRLAKTDLPGARTLLIQALAPLVTQGHQICLVFDGDKPGEETQEGLQVVFTGLKKNDTADKRIWKLSRGTQRSLPLVVVSLDKKIQTSVRRQATWVVSPLDMLAALT